MNPFTIAPALVGSSAYALYQTAEQAYFKVHPEEAGGERRWTVPDLATGGRERRLVPESLRAWIVMAMSYLFAEWALAGPEPFEEKLAKYPTLDAWAREESVGKCLAPGPDDTDRVDQMPYGILVHMAVSGTYMDTVLGRGWQKVHGLEPEREPALLKAIEELEIRTLAIGVSLTPRQAWDGIGDEAQRSAQDSEEVRLKQTAYRYVSAHFGKQRGQTLTVEQGGALLERLADLAPTMTEVELSALATHGVDLVLTVPDEVWLKIRKLAENEQVWRVVQGPHGNASQN